MYSGYVDRLSIDNEIINIVAITSLYRGECLYLGF